MIRNISDGSVHAVKYGTHHPGTSFEITTVCGRKLQLLGDGTKALWVYEDVACADCARLGKPRASKKKEDAREREPENEEPGDENQGG